MKDIKNTKKDSKKEAHKKYQNLSKEKKLTEKRHDKYVKIFLRNKSISYLSI